MKNLTDLLDVGGLLVGEVRRQSHWPIRGSRAGSCPRELASILCGATPKPFSARQLRLFDIGRQRELANTEALSCAIRGSALEMHVNPTVYDDLPEWATSYMVLSGYDGHAVPAPHIKPYAKMSVPIPLSGAQSVAAIERASRLFGQHIEPCAAGILIGVSPDVILLDHNRKATVIELKTKGGWGYKQLDAEGIDDSYRAQLSIQVMACQIAGYDVQAAAVLYENKDTSDVVALELPRSEWDRAHDVLVQWRRTIVQWLSTPEANFADAPLSESPAVHAVAALSKQVKGGARMLPWQCNYCSVGPVAGKCLPGLQVENAKPGAEIPAWRVSVSAPTAS